MRTDLHAPTMHLTGDIGCNTCAHDATATRISVEAAAARSLERNSTTYVYCFNCLIGYGIRQACADRDRYGPERREALAAGYQLNRRGEPQQETEP